MSTPRKAPERTARARPDLLLLGLEPDVAGGPRLPPSPAIFEPWSSISWCFHVFSMVSMYFLYISSSFGRSGRGKRLAECPEAMSLTPDWPQAQGLLQL